jgi:hypothetical protein
VLSTISGLFSWSGLWPTMDSNTLNSARGLVDSYWSQCAKGNPNGWACTTYSGSCASQAYKSCELRAGQAAPQ